MRQAKLGVQNPTEERILQCALRQFCDFGYNGTSVREITTASEVTKPTLYYYFKNKQELFTRLAETCFQMALDTVNNNLARKTGFKDSTLSILDSIDELYEQNSAALKFVHGVIAVPQSGTPEVGVTGFKNSLIERIDSVVDRAVAAGECAPDKKEFVRLVLWSLIAMHIQEVVNSEGARRNDRAAFDKVMAVIAECAKPGGH